MIKTFIKLQSEIRRLERINRTLEAELEKLTQELDRLRKNGMLQANTKEMPNDL